MALVGRVNSVLATELAGKLVVAASGEVDSSGWFMGRLSPRYYAVIPTDGFWDFDFRVDSPFGPVISSPFPVSATAVVPQVPWATGVRVHGTTNFVEYVFSGIVIQQSVATFDAAPSFVYQDTIAVYDDSIQPTGKTKWDWHGPHFEMKKLRHELVLTIDAPDEQMIRSCVQQAAAAGLIAAIIAALATGGAALPAAISAFLSTLEACIGAGTCRVDDQSHWIYWWT